APVSPPAEDLGGEAPALLGFDRRILEPAEADAEEAVPRADVEGSHRLAARPESLLAQARHRPRGRRSFPFLLLFLAVLVLPAALRMKRLPPEAGRARRVRVGRIAEGDLQAHRTVPGSQQVVTLGDEEAVGGPLAALAPGHRRALDGGDLRRREQAAGIECGAQCGARGRSLG